MGKGRLHQPIGTRLLDFYSSDDGRYSGVSCLSSPKGIECICNEKL